MNSIDQAINVKVSVTTLLDQTHIGHLHAFSNTHDVLVLRITNRSTAKIPRPESFKFINTAFIKSIQVIGPISKRTSGVSGGKTSTKVSGNVPNGAHSRSPSPSYATPTKLSINELETDLNRSLAKYKHMLQEVEKASGVTSAGKLLFEKLYLRFPDVKWQADAIIVAGLIKVSKPYMNRASCFNKLADNTINIEKVQHVVREFWQQMDAEKGG